MKFVRVEDRAGVLLATLDRPPANALAAELIEELTRFFEETTHAKGVVLASASPKIFSAGWDLPRVLELDRGGMEDFLRLFCDLVRRIFVFGPPVIAALPGHAIAGGLIVAAAADERWAGEGKGQLGLSEVLLGVPVPECCVDLFRHVIGARAAERLAATGENMTLEAAAAIGLVDRIVPAGVLVDQAVERARLLSELPSGAYAAIKRRARAAALDRFDRARSGDPFLDFWFAPEARARIRALIERIGKK